jgi:hypothetical protein
MKVKNHRQMMRSLTDPLNIPKLRALLEAHPVLTQEEFKTRQAQSIVPQEWDELSPKEERYYQQGPFSTHEDFRGAKGGTVPQLVQPGPGRQGYSGLEKFEIEKINNPSDEALNEIRQIIDNLDIKQNTILGKEVKNLPKEITVEKLATQIQTPGYKRPTIAKELLKRILNEKNIKTYDNYRTEKIVTVLNDALTKNKGNTLYIKPSAAVELLPEFEVKNVKGGGGNSMLKTYRNYIAGGERIASRAGVPIPEEIGGRKVADIVTDLDKNFLDVMGGRSRGTMNILNEIKLLDTLANENPDVSAAKLKELFEEAGGTNFTERLKKIHPVKMGNLTKGDTGVILKQAAEEGAISNSMPDSLRKAIKRYSVDLNINRFFKQAEKYRKSRPELAYKYTKAMNLISDANMKRLGMVGAGEHALPLSAIETAGASEDTYFKIDAYVDHELNDWKSKNFDQPIFRKKGLAYKYNNADKLGLSAKQKLDIQEDIMQRLDFMKKRAPELMENVTFDFTDGKFTANSSTPSILDLDEKGFKALNEKGNRINQKFITEMPDAVKLTSTGRIASIDDKFIKPVSKGIKIKPSVSDSKGLLGEGWSKFAKAAPKTSGALAATGRFLFHPVEMGMLPLFLAGEALYQNYANKRDLQKVLDEIPLSGEYGMPQYKKDLIMEGYIQQARDKGGVGLETYAIDQPNISGALEKIGFGDSNFLAQKAGEAIAGKREEERQIYEAERERQRKIFDIDAPMMAKGGRASYLDGGIVSLLKK